MVTTFTLRQAAARNSTLVSQDVVSRSIGTWDAFSSTAAGAWIGGRVATIHICVLMRGAIIISPLCHHTSLLLLFEVSVF